MLRQFNLLLRAMCVGFQAHTWPTEAFIHAGRRRGFATAAGEESLSIHILAVYVHEQINGTFDDIFDQLSKRVDLLEYANRGSSTKVSLEDARIIIEDIGASPDDLDAFLAEDKELDKSVGFQKPAKSADGWSRFSRHPRHALYGLKVDSANFSPSATAWAEDLPTEELLARMKREALGLWPNKKRVGGYVVCSLKGTFTLTADYMKQHPVDSEFNVWCQTHMTEGMKPCAGQCAGQKAVRWYDEAVEEPPFLSKNLLRVGYHRRPENGCQ